MAQKFLDYERLLQYCARNPGYDLKQVLAAIAEHVVPIVCGVGLDDIIDVMTEDDDEVHGGGDSFDLEQKEAVLDLYARRFDWVSCHNDVREAIDDVRAGTNLGGGEKYV